MKTTTQLQDNTLSARAEGFGRIKPHPVPASLAAASTATAAAHLTLVPRRDQAEVTTPSPVAFGRAAADETPRQALRPDSFALQIAARAHRSRELARILAALMHATAAAARRAHAHWQRARNARATGRALARLDDRTLRDLGFDRSEILSVAAGHTGVTDSTRAPRGWA